MRTRLPYIAGLLVVLACALALNAKRSFSASLEVAPNPARPGEMLAVTSSLTNQTADTESMTVSVEMRGPCGVAASKTYKVLLNGHQTDTSKARFQAPVCLGAYQAVLTVSDDRDGMLVGTSSKNFEVITKAGRANGK